LALRLFPKDGVKESNNGKELYWAHLKMETKTSLQNGVFLNKRQDDG
jgi:hypothetical protein